MNNLDIKQIMQLHFGILQHMHNTVIVVRDAKTATALHIFREKNYNIEEVNPKMYHITPRKHK